MYDLIYSSDSSIFIIDKLLGKYFVKKSCDLFEILENGYPVSYIIEINPYLNNTESLIK